MTNEKKIKMLEQEVHNLYKKQAEEERKQKFKNEIEAVAFSKKQDNEILEYIKRRKKELKIDNSTK